MYMLIQATEGGNFVHYIETLSYAGIFIWFIFFDQLTPIPAEISLLTIGYLSARGFFNPLIAVAPCVLAFLLVDLVYYFFTRSSKSIIGKVKKRSGSRLFEKYRARMEHHMISTVFILELIPRLRVLGPILVAMLNLPLRKFLWIDGISLLLFCCIWIGLGYVFHSSLATITSDLKGLENILFIAFALLIGISIILFFRKKNSGTSE